MTHVRCEICGVDWSARAAAHRATRQAPPGEASRRTGPLLSFVVALAAALSITLRPAPALAQAVGGRGPPGGLRGVVFDSLLGRPLPGATVWLPDLGRSTLTDGDGRYALDSLPAGQHVIGLAHPELDSLGLPTLAAAADVPAGGARTLDLATPSRPTLLRAACPADRSAGGLVFGAVRDAATGDRLAGAAVVLTSLQLDTAVSRNGGERLAVSLATRRVATDSVGMYYACGLTIGAVAAVRAQAGPFASGEVDVEVGQRGVARQDLIVGRAAAAAMPGAPTGSTDSAATVHQTRATVTGVVRDSSGAPRAGAWVTLDGAAGEGRTDERGRFRLGGLPAGTQTLEVRLLGFAPTRVAVDLRAGATARADVTLRDRAVVLARVDISAARQARVLADIERRRKLGFGYAMRAEDLRRRYTLSTTLREFPSVAVRPRSTIYGTPDDFTVLLQGADGACRANVFLDGRRSTELEIATYRVEDLLAIEVYPRFFSTPLEFQRWTDTMCGSVVVWTRWAR